MMEPASHFVLSYLLVRTVVLVRSLLHSIVLLLTGR